MNPAVAELIPKLNQALSAESVLFMINYKTNGVEQKGASLRCFCPIHREEMIRSLVIDTARSTFRCSFSGCRGARGGSFFDLYRLAKDLDDETAARELARELGLAVDARLWEQEAGPPPEPQRAAQDEPEAPPEPVAPLAARLLAAETALATLRQEVAELDRRERETRRRVEEIFASTEAELGQLGEQAARAAEALPALAARLESLSHRTAGLAEAAAVGELREGLFALEQSQREELEELRGQLKARFGELAGALELLPALETRLGALAGCLPETESTLQRMQIQVSEDQERLGRLIEETTRLRERVAGLEEARQTLERLEALAGAVAQLEERVAALAPPAAGPYSLLSPPRLQPSSPAPPTGSEAEQPPRNRIAYL